MKATQTGLARFLDDPISRIGKARCGLLTHPPAVDPGFRSSAELIAAAVGSRLVALFGPQHGFLGDKQDNMIESDHALHPLLGIPVHSLYGETRSPTPEMLAGLDVLLVDLQDVGTRVYTYIQTLSLAMAACQKAGVKVIILDRPNPLGRGVEGNLIEPDCFSFVGRFPIPMRHGLTMGEMANLIRAEVAECDLEVVAMEGYDPLAGFEETGLPWVMPSPNMPTLETAWVYPGQVLWEGTTLSEGRGTTRPFELWGAPYIEPYRLAREMETYGLKGVVLRPVFFEPTFHKHTGRLCGGLDLHVVDRKVYQPYPTSLALLQAVARLWPAEWGLREPPYEYEYERRPMDLILGQKGLVDRVTSGADLSGLVDEWQPEIDDFVEKCRKYYIY